jgi:hypothetical protein
LKEKELGTLSVAVLVASSVQLFKTCYKFEYTTRRHNPEAAKNLNGKIVSNPHFIQQCFESELLRQSVRLGDKPLETHDQ